MSIHHMQLMYWMTGACSYVTQQKGQTTTRMFAVCQAVTCLRLHICDWVRGSRWKNSPSLPQKFVFNPVIWLIANTRILFFSWSFCVINELVRVIEYIGSRCRFVISVIISYRTDILASDTRHLLSTRNQPQDWTYVTSKFLHASHNVAIL